MEEQMMSKEVAHKVLDYVREGVKVDPAMITEALIVTGDLRTLSTEEEEA